MATMGTAFIPQLPAAGAVNVYFGAEDTTAGTAYWTADQSGYAHVGYARVDVVAGTTIGGTVYGTANKNDFGYVAQSSRIINFFPNDELVKVSIRRGRTRPDQWDDVGECTIEVLNPNGNSDPDNNTGRYQRLISPTINPSTGVASPNYSTWIQPGMFTQVVFGSSAGTAIPLFTGVLEQVEPTDDRYSTAVYTFVDRLALAGRATLGESSKIGSVGDSGQWRLINLFGAARLADIINVNGGLNIIEKILDIRGFARPLQLKSSGDTILDAAKTVVAGQAGRIFSNRSGVISAWDRDYMQTVVNAGTAATFTDSPATVTGIGYDEIHTNQGQNFVYNSANVNVGTTIAATAKLDDSIGRYGERRADVDAVLQSSGDALALATFLCTNWSDPVKNVASLSLNAYGASQATLETLMKLDVQQQVRVYRKLPGGRVLDVNCVIEGIEIDIDPSTKRFTFYLSPKDTTAISWPA